jgi:hypothetical protein
MLLSPFAHVYNAIWPSFGPQNTLELSVAFLVDGCVRRITCFGIEAWSCLEALRSFPEGAWACCWPPTFNPLLQRERSNTRKAEQCQVFLDRIQRRHVRDSIAVAVANLPSLMVDLHPSSVDSTAHNLQGRTAIPRPPAVLSIGTHLPPRAHQ